MSFHLRPRSPGLCKSISEKNAFEVGYPIAKLDIIVPQIFTANKECPAVFVSSPSPKVLTCNDFPEDDGRSEQGNIAHMENLYLFTI